MNKILLLLAIIPAVLFGQNKLFLKQQDMVSLDDKVNEKILSGKLLQELNEKLYAVKNKSLLKENNTTVENEKTIRVVIYFENYPGGNELAELETLGVKYFPGTWTPPVANHPYGFMLAEVPVNSFIPAAELGFVKKLGSAAHKSFANNNQATKNIKADSSWAIGWTGTGVKVAILDSGLDTEPINSDLPFTIEKRDYSYYPDVIDDDVENTSSAHGTHVTGSVLGRGVLSAANTGNGGGAYKGSAPDADLVFLKIGNDESSNSSGEAMIAAMHAAVDTFHADVLSMSYGGWYDHHDGTSSIEQTVDWVYSQGKPFFISAGNSANDGHHYSGTVAANSSTGYIQVNVAAPSANSTWLVFNLVWSDGTARKNLSLQFYNSSKVQQSSVFYTPTQSSKGTESKYCYMEQAVPASSGILTYYLKVVNPTSSAQKFHLYEAQGDYAVYFNDPDPNYTIGQPASADYGFAVAAYVSRKNWSSSNGSSYYYIETLNDIASFSSRGPRVDETGGPSIASPGSVIISILDRDVATDDVFQIDDDGIFNLGESHYLIMQGTSMACPIAAGAAALLLHKYPDATPEEIYDAIKNSAISDSFTGTLPNDTWGSGKLDIYNAIKYMDESVPVELVSFTAATEQNNVNLKWQTATEINNYGFEIERSAVSGTIGWEKAGFVAGHGSTTQKNSYSYTDNNISALSKVYYRLKQIDLDGRYEYSNTVEVTVLPVKYALEQNYPNPFNPSTKIKFSLPEDSRVKISIYNIMGEKVAEPVNTVHPAGYGEVQFNASGMASGVYYYRIEASGVNTQSEFTSVKKMMVLK